MKKAGILEWLVVIPGLSSHEQQRVAHENERMVKNVKDLGLPMDRDFGSFKDLDAARLAIPAQFRDSSLFIIRCLHRTRQDVVHRKLFVKWVDVENFVAELPGGYQDYWLGLREVSEPDWSGTIVCSRDGAILIELWEGKHLQIDLTGSVNTSFRGMYGPMQTSFRWTENCTVRMKEVMIGALRYVLSDFRRAEPIFVEFSLTDKGYRFIGASRDPFWTG